MSTKYSDLLQSLQGAMTNSGLAISATELDVDAEMMLVTVEGREEFPIIVDIDMDQITCITNLWKQSEVNPDKLNDMLQNMLATNLPMPLSSFAKTGDQFQLFGAMSVQSSLEAIIEELSVLSDNTIDAIEAFESYLQ